MENEKKKALKGFTLIELIIVMAIVSILMLAVMKVSQPAIKIMNNTANSEKTYGYTDNIRSYLQAQLEYADALWVVPESQFGSASFISMRHPPVSGAVTTVELDDLDDAVYDFFDENYFGTVTYSGSGSSEFDIRPMRGIVNVLRLVNHDDGTFKAGQVTLRSYTFDSYSGAYDSPSGISEVSRTSEELAINEAYFNAYDAKDYSFSYALGAYDLEGDGGSGTETYKAVPEQKNGEKAVIKDYNDLAVSIILNTGAVDDSAGYRRFRNPSQISVANIPLININYHNGKVIGRNYVNTSAMDAMSTPIPQIITWGNEHATPIPSEADRTSVKGFYAFPWNSNPSGDYDVNFSDDIYFIYSYATDLE